MGGESHGHRRHHSTEAVRGQSISLTIQGHRERILVLVFELVSPLLEKHRNYQALGGTENL